MSTTIKIKNSNVVGKVPAAGSLESAELALNLKDRKLYSKDADGDVFEIGNAANVPGGGTPPGSGNEIGDLFFDTVNNVLLYWDGSEWVPVVDGDSIELGELSDVEVDGVVDGQVLVYDGNSGNWVPASPGSLAVDVDLDYTADPAKGTISNSAGDDAEIPLVNETNAGLMSPDDYKKLSEMPGFISGDTQPNNPSLGDIWIDTGVCPPTINVWDDCDDPGNPIWTPIGGGGGGGCVQGPVSIISSNGTELDSTLTAVGGNGVEEGAGLTATYQWTGAKTGSGSTIVADIEGDYTVTATITCVDGSTLSDSTVWTVSDSYVDMVNNTPPVIAVIGEGLDGAYEGNTLYVVTPATVNNGDNPAIVENQWFRNGSPVGTDQLYTLSAADTVGTAITCKQLFRDARTNELLSEASNAITVVERPAGAITFTAVITDDGTPQANTPGHVLTASAQNIVGGTAPIEYEYKWLVEGLTMGTNKTLNIISTFVGKIVSCEVTVAEPDGSRSETRTATYSKIIEVAGTINTPSVLAPQDGAGSGNSRYLKSDTIIEVEDGGTIPDPELNSGETWSDVDVTLVTQEPNAGGYVYDWSNVFNGNNDTENYYNNFWLAAATTSDQICDISNLFTTTLLSGVTVNNLKFAMDVSTGKIEFTINGTEHEFSKVGFDKFQVFEITNIDAPITSCTMVFTDSVANWGMQYIKVNDQFLTDPGKGPTVPYDATLTVDGSTDLADMSGSVFATDGAGSPGPYTQTPYKLETTEVESATQVDTSSYEYKAHQQNVTLSSLTWDSAELGPEIITTGDQPTTGWSASYWAFIKFNGPAQINWGPPASASAKTVSYFYSSDGIAWTFDSSYNQDSNTPNGPFVNSVNAAVYWAMGYKTGTNNPIGLDDLTDTYNPDNWYQYTQPQAATLIFPGAVSTNPDLQYFLPGDVIYTDPDDGSEVKVVSIDLSANTMTVDGGEWDTTNHEEVWSNYFNGPAATIGFKGSAFDGSTSARWGYQQGHEGVPGIPVSTIIWEYPTGIPYNDKVEIFIAANQRVRINDGTYIESAGLWETMTTGTGSLTRIEVDYASSANPNGDLYGLIALRVDGTDIVDRTDKSEIWSEYGSGQQFDPAYTWENVFAGTTANNGAFPATNSTISWVPTGGLPFSQSFSIVTAPGATNTPPFSATFQNAGVVTFTPRFVDGVSYDTERKEYVFVEGSDVLIRLDVSSGGSASKGNNLNAILVDGVLLQDSDQNFRGLDKAEYQTNGGQGDIVSVNTNDNTLLISNTGDRDNRWIAENKVGTNFAVAGPQFVDDPLLTADVELESSLFSTTPDDADTLKNIVWELNGATQDAGLSNPYKPTGLALNTEYTVRVKHQGNSLPDSAWSSSTTFTTGATRNLYTYYQDRIAGLISRIEDLESGV